MPTCMPTCPSWQWILRTGPTVEHHAKENGGVGGAAVTRQPISTYDLKSHATFPSISYYKIMLRYDVAIR